MRLLRRLWHALWLGRREHELDEELRFHLEMKQRELEADGLPPAEAATEARRAVGNLGATRHQARDVWMRPSIQGLALDCRLGLRMLLKYPGLTIVGGVAITVAAGVGVAFAEFSKDMLDPSLPLEGGDRIVGLRNWDRAAGRPDPRALHDFVTWRDELDTVEELGAFSMGQRGFTSETGESVTLQIAQVTASGFGLGEPAPFLGRALVAADERPDAPPVVVLGYDAWLRLFGGAMDAIGQQVDVSGAPTTVIGVMPEGFKFPLNQGAWMPLRANPLEHDRGTGPVIVMLGRLADGSSLREAQAELAAIGRRTAADFPETHKDLQAQVMMFASLFSDPGPSVVYAIRFAFILLMIVVCANVATLVFARTVIREGEIAVRTALGATRARIAVQLFAEALVLVGCATLLAMALADWGLVRGMDLFWRVQQAEAPFWVNDTLSRSTVLYAGTLALVGAFMIGVLPALKATGRQLQPGLSQLGTGSGASLRFGGIWTVIIVCQVALSVAFLPYAVSEGWRAFRDRALISAFPADTYLSARLSRVRLVPPGSLTEAEERAFSERTAQLFAEAKRRIASESGVSTVALADWLPGMNHPQSTIQLEPDPTLLQARSASRVLRVDPDYLEAMDAEIISGRGFSPGEYQADARVVLVNQTFVDEVTGGQNPLGRRLRFYRFGDPDPQPWFEVVGVIADPEMDVYGPNAHRAVYRPLVPGEVESAQLFVRLRSSGEAVGTRLHAIVAAMDQTLLIEDLVTVEDTWAAVHQSNRFFGWMLGLVVGVGLLLSMAGTYALMSFTVSRRTREIGIRVAVGAGPGRIVRAVFTRACVQVGLGAAIGMLVAWRLLWTQLQEDGPGVLLAVAGLLLLVGLLACAIPVRRALGIQPTDALRSGG